MKLQFIIISLILLGPLQSNSTYFEQKALCKQYKQEKNWKELSRLGTKLLESSHRSKMTDLYFDVGVAEYELANYPLANSFFSKYLENDKKTPFLEQAIQYKSLIADQLAKGRLTHLFNNKFLPKLFTDKTLAAELYEEIAQSRPLSILAAESYYKKAHLLVKERDYEEALLAFNKVIQRYPRLALSEKSHIEMLKVHLLQAEHPVKDLDILVQSQHQLTKLKRAFPSSEQSIQKAESLCVEIKENFAQELLNQAYIFEKKWNKKLSAAVYYKELLDLYPETTSAKLALKSLHRILRKDASIAQKIGYDVSEKA